MSEYQNQDLFSYNNNETKKSPEKESEKFYFSYSKFSLYNECPFKYKVRYIDKIKEKPKSFFYFGDVIHKTLEYFFRRVPPPKIEDLIKFLTEEWKSKPFEERGYLNQHYEKIDYNKALNVIKNFYQKHSENKEIPFQLEYKTYVDVDGITANIVADKLEYKGGGNIIIVDYKTGKPGERTKDQLYFYQKICEMDRNLIEKVKEIYRENVKKINVLDMVYYYVETLKEVKIPRADDREINCFWEDVLKTVENIKNKKFDPKPSELSCRWCDFKEQCPIYKDNSNLSIETLANEYIKLSNNIKQLEIKAQEIEEKILILMKNDFIDIISDGSNIKVKKSKMYEFKDRDEIIKILKQNNLYEKALRITLQSIYEIINSDDTPDEIKNELIDKSTIKYKLSIEEQKNE